MKSGMIAADLIAKYPNKKLKGYDQAIRNSAISQELKELEIFDLDLNTGFGAAY